MPKYIVVTGGVMSGLGKGVTTAAIAKLLLLAGLKVSCAKIDPYLNVDAGTMNPLIHGEVFVTDDGGETDMDIGTYERFLNQNLTRCHNITTGQVYLRVVQREREGRYLGSCVQIIPQITDEIKSGIREVSRITDVDVLIIECGGTVGDIESLPFLEAFRQLRLEEGASNTLFVHVTLAPILDPVGEQKTKPTQHSVQELRRIGIQPDLIIVRSRSPLSQSARQKISLFTSTEASAVISNPDTSSIYKVPEILERERIVSTICERLHLGVREVVWGDWLKIAESYTSPREIVKIAIVGKYVELADSYVSVNQALAHAGAFNGVGVDLRWVDAESFEDGKTLDTLADFHGILIPGGFGKRGSEGKILVANHARKNGIPFLGLCFGFQLALVSYARYVCGLENANSVELDPNTPNPVINLLPEQRNVKEMGASMRLGGHDIFIIENTLAYNIYGEEVIRERHRHRYELDHEYRVKLEAHGLKFSAFSDEGRRAEILEIPKHPFYFSTQFHPEFVSRPGKPEPAYSAFVQAALQRKKGTPTSHNLVHNSSATQPDLQHAEAG